MYLKFGPVRVHVTLPFAAVLAYAANTGRGEGLLLLFVSALLHECGHLIFLFACGCRRPTLVLHPGGAAITGCPLETLTCLQTVLVSAAGPAVNLLLALILRVVLPGTQTLIRMQLLLGLCNLLPLPVLDGGRILSALSGRYLPTQAETVCTVLGAASLSLLTAFAAFLFLRRREIGSVQLFAGYCLVKTLLPPLKPWLQNRDRGKTNDI
ncbi:MAG: site-2 protease family protein [Clostridia bacterium]|nr:site-2 protease family protein [Clostridia bacterium]